MNESDKKDISRILKFWFQETTDKKRFRKDANFDRLVKTKFEKLYWRVFKGETKSWRSTPQGRLAEIIVLDQFARNIFRNNKQSFAGDKQALTLARMALALGADIKTPKKQRGFFYMPFMHSESKNVHEEALKIFQNKSDKKGLGFEVKHKKIIDRFGRYPHRNKVLGRKSTPEELKFLKENNGF